MLLTQPQKASICVDNTAKKLSGCVDSEKDSVDVLLTQPKKGSTDMLLTHPKSSVDVVTTAKKTQLMCC